ncbi:phosphate-starvation-inducible PsiE family protein [Dolichospermum circinale]|uniref:Phosphate-starvation-inducible PsiE family protein n=1 Tax=Dolichospermum circinale CS-537/01 TaxID=3021739 RepID=A0ABT5A8E2_9CYAN|nr:phosphate-starvation-inducible PsiE family protein [Dolichospermum circinale]MDB9488238.1 phosphate-starvation-inducible PsiE family protein [Dolichospermum circinale CS-537/01]
MAKWIIIEVNNWFKRDRIVRNLEIFQDIIVISLCVGLFCVMLIRLGDMFLSFLRPLDIRQVTSDILFILILVELFRLLVDYLQERSISVGAAVEITIVSALREVILRGVLEIPLNQLFGLSIFLLVLAGIFLALPWMTTLSEQMKIGKHQIIELEPES